MIGRFQKSSHACDGSTSKAPCEALSDAALTGPSPVGAIHIRLLLDEYLGDGQVAESGRAVQGGDLVAICQDARAPARSRASCNM
eukprot:4142572-Pleurochrysis_carterae.AAC.1